MDVEGLTKVIVQRTTKICDIDSETLWLLAILSSKPESISCIVKLVPVIYKYLSETICKCDKSTKQVYCFNLISLVCCRYNNFLISDLCMS